MCGGNGFCDFLILANFLQDTVFISNTAFLLSSSTNPSAWKYRLYSVLQHLASVLSSFHLTNSDLIPLACASLIAVGMSIFFMNPCSSILNNTFCILSCLSVPDSNIPTELYIHGLFRSIGSFGACVLSKNIFLAHLPSEEGLVKSVGYGCSSLQVRSVLLYNSMNFISKALGCSNSFIKLFKALT